MVPSMGTEEHKRRWALHVAASSSNDWTFWVYETEDGQWVAVEVESGVHGEPGENACEALDNYWREHG